MTTEEPVAQGKAYTTRALQLAGWQVPLESAPNEGDAMLLETKVTQLCGLYLPARVITQRWQPVAEAEQTAAEIATQNAKAQLAEGEQVQNVVLQTNLNEDGSQMTVYAILEVQRQIGEPGALAPVPTQPPGGA